MSDGAGGREGELGALLGLLFQAHPWHGLAPAVIDGSLDVLNAYIEIVPTDSVKYELDKPSGHLRLDRPHRFSSQCPSLYGFIPQTYCGDSVAARAGERLRKPGIEGDADPLDVCVLSEKPFAHGAFVLHARPIGGLRVIDGNQADDKIISVLENDLTYGAMRDIGDCPGGIIERLRHFFLSYKQLPGEGARKVEVAEVYERAEALETVRRSLADYRAKFGAPEGRVAELRRLLR